MPSSLKKGTKERYLVLRQHEYESPKYWVWADAESTDFLNDETFQDDIAEEIAFFGGEVEIILVKVLGPVNVDCERLEKVRKDFELENEEEE